MLWNIWHYDFAICEYFYRYYAVWMYHRNIIMESQSADTRKAGVILWL